MPVLSHGAMVDDALANGFVRLSTEFVSHDVNIDYLNSASPQALQPTPSLQIRLAKLLGILWELLYAFDASDRAEVEVTK